MNVLFLKEKFRNFFPIGAPQKCFPGPAVALNGPDRKSYTGSRLPSNSMTLDDLKCQNRGFYGFFGNFLAVRHISRANCAEIHWDKHGKAYQFFSIKLRFQRSKSRFSRFKETCAQGHQRAVLL